jgi:predicted regulator of Ras-like GTPase activity (Roadblock/LC7/MglB family)
MFTLPQLIQEDISGMEAALAALITGSESISAFVIDKGGFLVCGKGGGDQFDTTTVAALSAATYTANQAIASLIGEPNFSSIYQQGENFSLYISNIDEQCLLAVIFNARLSVGAVKYYAAGTTKQIAGQLQRARERAPDQGIDLAMMNITDSAGFFKQKPSDSK